MSDKDLRTGLFIIIIITAIAFLAITADVMTKHPSIPWFGFGILAVLIVEAVGYLIYHLVKHIKTGQ